MRHKSGCPIESQQKRSLQIHCENKINDSVWRTGEWKHA